ncbi:MAG: hypothetical protein QOI80_1027 [Solirubrobacteraceae bacterium]|nr:hypothetical protein [Solirubrobacteraceae bacterium]
MRRPSTTEVLGTTAVGVTVAVIASEYWGVWRRGSAPLPDETDDVLGAGAEAARETVEVAVAGYKASPTRENAALNLLLSYAITAATVRLSTYSIRTRGSFGPFRNRAVAGRHIHHYIPGIGLAFLAGGASVVSRNESLDRWFAVPLGVGAALTMDEAALLVELEDVYWSEEGVLSVQATLATLSLLGALALGHRAFRRGEPEVLGPSSGGGDAPDLARAA